jgi:hypothetical protein
MEYIYDHGQFADLPYEKMVSEFKKHYPQFFGEHGTTINGSFEEEAEEERSRT